MKTNGVSTVSRAKAIWRGFVSSIAMGACLTLPSLIHAQTSIAPPPGMIAWWPGDGNANDIFGTNNGVLLGGATASAVGKAGQAFNLNGTSAYVEVADSPTLDLPGGMTVEPKNGS